MRRLTTGEPDKMFWELISPPGLRNYIESLPTKFNMYYFAKLVSEGVMRDNLSMEQQIKYARVTEGTLMYLFDHHNHENIALFTSYYIPFFYIAVRVFPDIKPLTFGHMFKQFVRFAGSYPIAKDEDDVCVVITDFLKSIKK